jgi:hypothetical protein
MGSQLTVIEPIQPPDVRRPAKLTTLPSWVQQRCDSLSKASQPDKEGIHREVQVLPANLILDHAQKDHVEQHIRSIDKILGMTPENDARHGELTLTTVTKMTLVLPSRESGDLAGEAKGEAYMAALEDIPSWAVQEAMRRWHRSECGEKYDYRWQPVPSVMREISMTEVYRVRAVRRQLNNLLLAEPKREFTAEEEEEMRIKMAKFLRLRSM